jgi:serine/threonine protein kinase
MCALKVPHEAMLQDSVQSRTLIQEAAILSSIRHPNVVSCFGSVVDVGTSNAEAAIGVGMVNTEQLLWHKPLCGILLEFCSGGSLRQLMSSPQWDTTPWRQRLRWALDAATGLAFLHEKEIVHRDIKSPNLLLMDGRLKVADFGLARFFTSSAGASTTKTVGSPAWMAPEVITHGTHVSPPSDIYSFGIVLWEIMTGEIPWQSCTSMHIAYQVVCNAARLPLPSPPLTSQLPHGYINLIKDCWSTDPIERPTCSAVVLRLKHMLQYQEQFENRELKGMYM